MGGHQQADWQNFIEEESLGGGNVTVGNSWPFLPLVSYTFFSLIKLSKESGTYRKLKGFVCPLMSFALGGNETLAPSSLLHAQRAEAGHLLGVIRRSRMKDATFQQPWPSPGMANRDSTLRGRPLEVGHFLAIIQRSSSRTTIATFQTPIAFPSSGEPQFTLLRPSSISWALVVIGRSRTQNVSYQSAIVFASSGEPPLTSLTLASTILYMSIIVGAMINTVLYPENPVTGAVILSARC